MKQDDLNNLLLESYQGVTDFLSSVYGRNCSVILYQVNEKEGTGTIIAVKNKPPFSAEIGGEMGVVGKRVLENRSKGYRYLINANSSEEDSNPVKICYFLIRNQKDEVIGLLLLMFEIGFMIQHKNFLDQFLGQEAVNENRMEENDYYYELSNDGFSVGKYVQGIISKIVVDSGIPVNRMTMDEKAEVVKKLDNMEVFNLKGAVKETASQLMVSVATMYRLMKRELD